MAASSEPCRRALELDAQLLDTYQGTAALQAANSVGEVTLIRKNWEVVFAVRHQALLRVVFHKREILEGSGKFLMQTDVRAYVTVGGTGAEAAEALTVPAQVYLVVLKPQLLGAL